MAIEYMGLNNIQGPLAVIEGVDDTFYEEMVTVTLDNGEKRIGRVIEISGDKAVIQVFEGTSNLSLTNTKTKFMGEPMRLPLSKEMLGRTLDGIGRPIDGLGDYFADEVRDVNGQPINPVSREYPNNFIQTGISSIDCLATLISVKSFLYSQATVFRMTTLPYRLQDRQRLLTRMTKTEKSSLSYSRQWALSMTLQTTLKSHLKKAVFWVRL